MTRPIPTQEVKPSEEEVLIEESKRRYMTDVYFHALVDLSVNVMDLSVRNSSGGNGLSRNEKIVARYTASIALLLKEKKVAS